MHFYELLEKYLVNKNSFYCGSLVYDKSNHFPGGSDGKASAYNAGDSGLIPGSERSAGEGNGNPLQRSCLENPRDGGAWWAAVYRVAQSPTRLKRLLSSRFSRVQLFSTPWTVAHQSPLSMEFYRQ